MYQACAAYWPSASLAVMSAAVADYSPTSQSLEKIKKTTDSFSLELSKTKDILASLGASKHNGQVLVGFALENRNEKEYAQKKNADMIVLNSLNDSGAGFGFDTNKVTIFEKGGNEIPYERKPKKEVARDIVDRIVKMLYA
jgi:phosphopantothenoylcysteine decarboxylase/phosphopantothenate--cysteine ligase